MKNSVSIIMPAYKEEEFINDALKNLVETFRTHNFDFEIITVIDVVQNDKTLEIVQNLAEFSKEIVMVTRQGKQGIGSAIREGIKNATKDTILIATAEISEDPEDLAEMAKKMNEGYDMVFGNRFYADAKREGYELKKYIGNRLCNYTIKILFGMKSQDITNGIKIYKSSILKQMKTTSYGFEIFAEIPITAYVNGFRNFAEIPIKHKARDNVYSKFNLTKEGQRFFGAVTKCYLYKLKKSFG